MADNPLTYYNEAKAILDAYEAASRARAAATVPHIRQAMPRRGGNSFYRDKNDYTKFCVTLCGAPVTDQDVDFRTAGTKKFKMGGYQVCPECLKKNR